MEELDNIKIEDSNIVINKWIEWVHDQLPNSGLLRELMTSLLFIFGHCLICINLDGCCFLERKMPSQPLHENCHCYTKYKSEWAVKSSIKAECNIKKFTDYIFSAKKGKKYLFESWGFNVNDSQDLKYEFEKQAKEKYANGNYELKNLDIFGQRINIEIDLKGNKFYSGWMVCPNGLIKNITPFGGCVR